MTSDRRRPHTSKRDRNNADDPTADRPEHTLTTRNWYPIPQPTPDHQNTMRPRCPIPPIDGDPTPNTRSSGRPNDRGRSKNAAMPDPISTTPYRSLERTHPPPLRRQIRRSPVITNHTSVSHHIHIANAPAPKPDPHPMPLARRPTPPKSTSSPTTPPIPLKADQLSPPPPTHHHAPRPSPKNPPQLDVIRRQIPLYHPISPPPLTGDHPQSASTSASPSPKSQQIENRNTATLPPINVTTKRPPPPSNLLTTPPFPTSSPNHPAIQHTPNPNPTPPPPSPPPHIPTPPTTTLHPHPSPPTPPPSTPHHPNHDYRVNIGPLDLRRSCMFRRHVQG